MEVTNSLLVALMFVTIVAMGIGNIVMALGARFGSRSITRDRLRTSWQVLLLLVYFNFFWHTLELLKIEDWWFSGFLLFIAGPILLFFATSVLLEAKAEGDDDGSDIPPRFHWLMAMVQVWVVVAVVVLLDAGFATAEAMNLVNAGAFVVLALLPKQPAQLVGNGFFWLLVVGSLILRGTGIIGG